MPLTNRQYEDTKSTLIPILSRHSAPVIMIALMDLYTSMGKNIEAAVLEECCSKLGVTFAAQRIPSSSNPKESYKVTKTPNGELVCECQGWRFCKTPNKWNETQKSCKHTRIAEKNPSKWESVVNLPSQDFVPVVAASVVSNTQTPSGSIRKIVFDDDDE